MSTFRPRFAAFLAIFTLTSIALAHDPTETAKPQPVPESVAHRPTAIPDRIVLTWTADPATSAAVTWRTDTTVTRPIAQIAPAEDGPAFVENATTIEGVTAPVESDLGKAHFHSVEFTNLQPSSRYLYRVGDSVNWSEWIAFQTASDKPEPFTFLYVGDAQNDVKQHWSRLIREAYTRAPDARFIIHAGDLINDAKRDAEWGEWFYAAGWVHAMLPTVPTPGNHEYTDRDADGKPVLSRHWRPQFALPLNGPKDLEETVYYIDYQGVRIVSLNSNGKLEEQAQWLDSILTNNPNRWTILTFHHPILMTLPQRDNPLVRAAWKPVIDKHRVDLVLQGHDHNYARSGLIGGDNSPGGATVKEGGTIYVVSISGPKMYPGEKQDWMRLQANGVQLFQVIRVEGDTLRYSSFTALGEPFDAFELRKAASGENQIAESPNP